MADRVQARAERGRIGAGITKEYIQRDNHGFSGFGYRHDDEELGDDDRTGPKPHIDKLVVWGGTVANCAESALSSIVDQEAKFLREVVYAPSRTKGGCLVRPKYHMGDRGGRQTFPRLERMTIRARPALLPSRYGWDAPSLTRLNVLVDAGGVEEAATSIEQWIRGYDHPQPRHRRNVPILAQLWQQCPALQEVIFTLSRWSKVTKKTRRFHSVFCVHVRHLAATSPPPALTDLVSVLQPSSRARFR
mmetsp:Transcript_26229/g.61530  ORF Transcript_26229/g.61530 Transcript_26229/m.61530 type:complete len:247 (-) Transcript_26229:956-1696(-)